jgi:hypothetical protein
MAKPPYVSVTLSPGWPAAYVDLTSYLTRESGSTLTSTIESPIELCTFTAPEVTLMGYDPTGYVKGLFSAITPTSTNYIVKLALGVYDPTTGFLGQDVTLTCYVIPNTLQFDTVTNAFQFSIVGAAHLLATTPAATIPSLNRTAASLAAAQSTGGYWATKWILNQDVSPLDATIRVTVNPGFSTKVCDFQGQDQIQLGGNETFTVISVASDGADPPVYWTLGLNASAQSKYTAASGVPVALLTPYARNISLQTLVTTLFNAAGISLRGYYGSAPLPFLTAPFASPVDTTGLPSGVAVTGIAPVAFAGPPAPIAVGTPGEVYQATGPTSGFTPLALRADPPIDPTNSLTTYVYTGQRQKLTRASAPRFGLNATAVYYAYDPSQYGGTQNRYLLTFTLQADSAAGPYNFTTQLAWQTYVVGTDSWSVPTVLWAGLADTTSTHIPAFGPLAGITVDTTGTILFVDLFVASTGAPLSCQISSYQPTGATPATGTLTRGRVATMNGQMNLLAPGVVGIFQTDGYLGQPPNVYVYTVTAAGVMWLALTWPCSPYLVGSSIKLNRGDNKYYGLVSDPVAGISLLRWTSSPLTLGPDPSWTPAVLFPGPPPSGTGGIFHPYDVDLIAPSTAGGPGSGQYPMYIFIAGAVYYVSTTGSGVVTYADMTGLSVSDALSQLTVLNAGIFYCGGFSSEWNFRSRSAPDPTAPIYTSDQLDAPVTLGGITYPVPIISLSTQNVYNLWVGYVSVTNENDASIFGEAGDVSYSSANAANTANITSQSLELQCRFVPSSSFAAALSASLLAYCGAQKRVIDVVVQRDGLHDYSVGNTFHLNVDGANRWFQITQSQTPFYGSTTQIEALEV